MMVMSLANHRIRSLPLTISLTRSFRSAKSEGGDINFKPLYGRLSESSSSVDETLSEWLNEGKTVNQYLLAKLVWKFDNLNNFKNALELTEWMENKGFEVGSSCQARRISHITKIKGIEMAGKKFLCFPEHAKNEKTYGALLSCYCMEKMEDKAIALFEKMKELNFANLMAYNNIMSLYMKLGNPQKVFDYFQRMKLANISPNKFTLDSLCYASLNDIIPIDSVIEEMKEEKFLSCIKMASFFNSKGAYEKTFTILKKAEEIMDKERHAFYSLMCLYAEAGNKIETIRIWNLLNAAFLRCTNTCYYNFLNAFKILGDMDGMKQCFEKWESVCIFYDEKFCYLMIDAYLEKGMVEEAESLKKKNVEKGRRSKSSFLDRSTNCYDDSSIYQRI